MPLGSGVIMVSKVLAGVVEASPGDYSSLWDFKIGGYPRMPASESGKCSSFLTLART